MSNSSETTTVPPKPVFASVQSGDAIGPAPWGSRVIYAGTNPAAIDISHNGGKILNGAGGTNPPMKLIVFGKKPSPWVEGPVILEVMMQMNAKPPWVSRQQATGYTIRVELWSPFVRADFSYFLTPLQGD